jgi:peptidoglycan/LPS O-acetylase OafA/YrhL
MTSCGGPATVWPVIDRARIARAFSLRRNARALWERKPSHLAPLDGLRALAILWTISFHALWFLVEELPARRYGVLVLAPRLTPAWRGHFGVDAFFVLSGFLIGGLLLDERARTGGLRLAPFYVRRLMRLWPALLAAIALFAVSGAAHPERLWMNALYVSNLAPVAAVSMGWTWSLAIEEHFYLVCPWLVLAIAPLATAQRVRVLAALLALSCVVAAIVTIAGDFHARDTEIVINRAPREWAEGYDHLYAKPWMRVGPLLAGVMAAVLHRDARFRDALARMRWRGGVVIGVALVLGALSGSWRAFVDAPRWLEVGYIATYRVVFGLCVATVLLFSISDDVAGKWLGRVLAARVFHPIAQLAYAAYLVNPIVTRLVQHALADRLVGPPLWIFAIAFSSSLVVTFAVATVIHLFVERPFMELRPSAPTEPAPVAAWRAPLAVQIAVMTMLGIVLPLALSAILGA